MPAAHSPASHPHDADSLVLSHNGLI
jgi:hypothetical protein